MKKGLSTGQLHCHKIRAGRFWAVLITIVLLVVAGRTGAQERDPVVQRWMDEAKRYYWGIGVEQDYRRALELYEQAAALGDVEAHYIAGGMYYTGKGSERDPFRAFKHLDYAASRGKSSSDSQRALAQFYLVGSVVPQNFDKAAGLFEQAAEAGDASAQLELGFLHFTGKGVEQDYQRAFELFQEAAMNNNNMAQYNLAIMWYTGNGVEESDIIKAYAWFSIAAINNFPDAVAARNYLETVLGQDELERAQQEAAALYGRIAQ